MMKRSKILYSVKILLTTYLLYIAGLLAGEALIILGSLPFGYNATDRQLPQDIMLLCSFFGYATVIAAVVLFTVKVNRISLRCIGLDKNVRTLFKGMLWGVISLVLILLLLLAFGFIRYEGIDLDLNRPLFLLFFPAFLVQSSMEEVVCRGYLLHRLNEKISFPASAVLSILFFSVFHFSKLFEEGFVTGIVGAANLVLIGGIFTMLTRYDKNVYSAIGFHWIWNFMLYCVTGLNLSGIKATESLFRFSVVNGFFAGGGYGIESSMITTVVCGAVFVVIIGMEKGRVKKHGIQQ